MESHAAAHACRDTLDPARAPTSADNQAKRAVQTGAIPLANAIAPAPDSSAIAKLGANDPIDSRPASERPTAKGQVQVELGYVQRGRNREPAAARMWASTARRTSRTSFSSHGPSVAQLPNPVTHCARTCCDVRWGGRRVVPTMTYQMNSSRYLAAVCARRSRAAPAAVSQAELVRRWRRDGPRPAADSPGGRVWRADGSSSRALPRELRSPGRPTLTGASGHELRLDGLACAVGDPMPADDAGGSTTSRLEPPDARVLWSRAQRLGFRASLDVRFCNRSPAPLTRALRRSPEVSRCYVVVLCAYPICWSAP